MKNKTGIENTTEEAFMMKQYAQWICHLERLDGRAIKRMEERFCNPREFVEADEKILETVLTKSQMKEFLEERIKLKGGAGIAHNYEQMLQRGISFVWKQEKEYPAKLLEIPDAPYGLYYLGRLPEEEKISVAIIGARECSSYGEYVAKNLGTYLAGKGVQIISGMARGIDGISQKAAIEAGGNSYGVLGCGVDICYPESNRYLYEKLRDHGGVLSALPIGTKPIPRNFPPRNRIVSGLADCVVVVEARKKSGTLITVDMALEQGREVYVVPGRMTDSLSEGCNKLIREGAGVITCAEDFFDELMRNIGKLKGIQKEEFIQQTLSFEGETQPIRYEGNLQRVYEAIDVTPCNVNQLAERLQLSSKELSVYLMKLCMDNVVVQLSPGNFVKNFG